MKTPRQVRLHGDVSGDTMALLAKHQGQAPLTLEVRDKTGHKVIHCPAEVVCVDVDSGHLSLRVDAVLLFRLDQGGYEEVEAKATIAELTKRARLENSPTRNGTRAETMQRDETVRAAYEEGDSVAEIALRMGRSLEAIYQSLRRTGGMG